MIEKQFKVTNISENGNTGLFWLGKDNLSVYDVVRVLNELYDENKELKARCEDYRKLSIQYKQKYDEKISDNTFLEEENKELKDKNSRLQETLAFRSNQLALMEGLIDDLGSEEMARQMEEILE